MTMPPSYPYRHHHHTTRFHGFDIVNTAIYKEDLLWGIPQFNNFLEAFLSIFQSITLEGWVDIMYTVSKSASVHA